jgi:hypothetical protein
MEIPNQQAVETRIKNACDYLYAKGRRLIEEKAHERTIVANFLVPPLAKLFPDWDVYPEYNREGKIEDREAKTDDEGNRLFPDIIIHKHGPDGPNLAVVQVKGHWNRETRKKDEDDLKAMQKKHGYQFLYRLELGRDSYQLISVL